MVTKKKSSKTSKKEDTKETKIVVSVFERHLTCGLTREEVEDRSQKMARALSDHDVREAELKERAKRDKSELKDMENEVRRLSNSVRDKCEDRTVKCERRMNYETGKVTDVRLDTGEVIEERDMSDTEKQRGLPFDGAPDVDDEFGNDEDDEAAE